MKTSSCLGASLMNVKNANSGQKKRKTFLLWSKCGSWERVGETNRKLWPRDTSTAPNGAEQWKVDWLSLSKTKMKQIYLCFLSVVEMFSLSHWAWMLPQRDLSVDELIKLLSHCSEPGLSKGAKRSDLTKWTQISVLGVCFSCRTFT